MSSGFLAKVYEIIAPISFAKGTTAERKTKKKLSFDNHLLLQ